MLTVGRGGVPVTGKGAVQRQQAHLEGRPGGIRELGRAEGEHRGGARREGAAPGRAQGQVVRQSAHLS